MARLNAPRFLVFIELPGTSDALDTPGVLECEVQTDNRDGIQWDVTRSRRSWPKTTDAPMLWASFLAWHAMKRTGAAELRGMDLDAFLAVCLEVRPVREDGTDVALEEATPEDFTIPPTKPATSAG